MFIFINLYRIISYYIKIFINNKMVGFSLINPITNETIPVHSYFYCRRKHCIYYYLGSNTRGSLIFLVQSIECPSDMKYEFLKKDNLFITAKKIDIKESNKMFLKIRRKIRNTKYDYDNFIRDDIDLLIYFSKESRKNNKKILKDSGSNQKNEEWKYKPRPKRRYPRRSRKVSESFHNTDIDESNIVSGSRKRRFKPLV